MNVLYIVGLALVVASLVFCFTQYKKVLPGPLGIAGTLLVAVFYVATDRPMISVLWFGFAAVHAVTTFLGVRRARS